ncbi:ParB family protein [Nocardioides alkalitolerans]|uniref:ParB family protein n=1 Tax=Nocardioides alkalitolerans TaxID=281714 RepID=UPI00069494AF|nr:hypothetical protein [Nocardioides alkalitolerans]
MTENRRSIEGLSPRRGEQDLSRLRRSNRPQTTEQPAAAAPSTSQTAGPSTDQQVDTDSVSTPPAVTAVATPDTPTTAAAKTRATIYLDNELRGRSRTAYRATAQQEGESSWSEFIENAIRREVERREHLYNAGTSYEISTQPLPTGRPLG